MVGHPVLVGVHRVLVRAVRPEEVDRDLRQRRAVAAAQHGDLHRTRLGGVRAAAAIAAGVAPAVEPARHLAARGGGHQERDRAAHQKLAPAPSDSCTVDPGGNGWTRSSPTRSNPTSCAAP